MDLRVAGRRIGLEDTFFHGKRRILKGRAQRFCLKTDQHELSKDFWDICILRTDRKLSFSERDAFFGEIGSMILDRRIEVGKRSFSIVLEDIVRVRVRRGHVFFHGYCSNV